MNSVGSRSRECTGEPEDGGSPARRALPDRVPLGAERSARRGQGRRRLRDLRGRAVARSKRSAPRPSGCPSVPAAAPSPVRASGHRRRCSQSRPDGRCRARVDATRRVPARRAGRWPSPRRPRSCSLREADEIVCASPLAHRDPVARGRGVDAARREPRRTACLAPCGRRPASRSSCRRCRSVKLRRRSAPELHEHLPSPGCYSAVARRSSDGVVAAARHARHPRPPVHERGRRVRRRGRAAHRAAVAQAERGHGRVVAAALALASDLARVRSGTALSTAASTSSSMRRRSPTANRWRARPRPRHVACSKAYADAGRRRRERPQRRVAARLVARRRRARRHFAPCCAARSTSAASSSTCSADRSPPVALHVAMVRRDDATPRGVVLVAHSVPTSPRAERTFRQRVPSAPSDWGHATELDDIRGAGRDRRHRRDRVHEGIRPHRAGDRRGGGRARDRRRRACNPPTSTASRGRARSPTSTSPRSTNTSARRTRCGRRRGAAAWRGPRPRRTSRRRRSREGKARHVAQRVPGRVGDAARVDDRRAGRGARDAVAEAEPRGAVRLVPAAGLLRVDHAPAHDRVRHDARAVRRDRGRVPPAREPESRRGDARPADDDRRLPRRAVPRRSAAAARLVPHLRRRRRVRDDERRTGARPARTAGGRCRRGGGVLGERHALGAAARVHEHAAGVLRARRVRDGRPRARRRRRAHGVRPVHRREPDADRGHGVLREGRGGRVRRGRHAVPRRRASCRSTPTAACCRTRTCSASRTSSSA